MIEYGNDRFVVFRMFGSVVPRSSLWGSVALAEVLIFKYCLTEEIIFSVFSHPYAHQVFSISLSLLLVFRANLAYARFWEGRSTVQTMSTKWSDAAMMLVAFENNGQADAMFVVRLIHCFSLMHVLAIQMLRDDWDLSHIVTHKLVRPQIPAYLPWNCNAVDDDMYLLQSLGGLSPLEAEELHGQHNRVFALNVWIMRLIIFHHTCCDGLAIAPAILSRPMQLMSDGMGAFMQAQKIKETPFPFPYAQLVLFTLVFFTISAPIVIVAYVDDIISASLLAFICTTAFVALNEASKEMEDPFGFDPNDLALTELHDSFISTISLLCYECDSINPRRKDLLDECYPAEDCQSSDHIVLLPSEAKPLQLSALPPQPESPSTAKPFPLAGVNLAAAAIAAASASTTVGVSVGSPPGSPEDSFPSELRELVGSSPQHLPAGERVVENKALAVGGAARRSPSPITGGRGRPGLRVRPSADGEFSLARDESDGSMSPATPGAYARSRRRSSGGHSLASDCRSDRSTARSEKSDMHLDLSLPGESLV
mmetsp:Transcript_33081/g.75640  ORF Transcript_33081/g.75640 Transcript_33081/m.75640 type:complete len:538 (-) Transcript_33081:328-1941(-)